MTPTFRDGAAQVRVPATSANLGPGYDAFGLALSWYDDVVARVADGGLRVDVSGEGDDVARDESHLVVRAMRAAFDRLGGQPSGIELSCTNRIPHGRGLGSSAAAIVAGVSLARALVDGGADLLPDDALFALAAELEGHLDNVAACCYGGITIAWAQDGTARAARGTVRAPIRPVALVPPYESSTHAARGLLPATVPHADAAFAVGRGALLFAVLSGAAGSPDGLLVATDDRLHQPYRAAAMPQTAELVRALRADGHAAVVSGAGPSVLVLARDEVEVHNVAAATPSDWRCEALSVDTDGARVTSGPE
ncbi:MAG TPA: homoserine kinase [Jatrophihabitantaceae bacterium]